MSDKEIIIDKIRDAFSGNDHPGDAYLQGSVEGCEPYEEVGPFQGQSDWRIVESDFLDAHAGALNFLSAAGFRFFLPAYLIADVEGRLIYAEPLFHLTHGFSEVTVEALKKVDVGLPRAGRSALVNPRRYGAMTFYDYARYRLSVFTREETGAIVAYLKYKRDSAASVFEKEGIEAALNSFWLERAQTAPLGESLKRHQTEQDEFLATIKDNK
jgi:hypothetical protein